METTMATTIGDFIEQGWNDHDSDLAGVADRLDAGLPLLKREPAKTGEFVGLVEHVVLSHLGDADAMSRWIERLAPLAAEQPDAQAPLARSRLALRLLRGEAVGADEQPRDVLIRAHGSAANGACARGDVGRARALLHAATALAPDDDMGAVKALAAVSNNLASQLLADGRGPEPDALMMEAAELAQRCWHRAGTWMNAERADYLLAVCAAAMGDGQRALRHANACLSLCTAHGADAFELFFAREALGKASLAAGNRGNASDALAHMAELLPAIADEGDRAYAQSVYDKVKAALGTA
jgi:hypothetical protein